MGGHEGLREWMGEGGTMGRTKEGRIGDEGALPAMGGPPGTHGDVCALDEIVPSAVQSSLLIFGFAS